MRLLQCLIPTLGLVLWAAPASAQDSTLVTAGARYQASGVHRFFFGPGYRDLWSTPFRVAYLDLASEAGGLTPTGTGGGLQTQGLRFTGANGRPYSFRSLDKNPTEVLPDEFQDTVVQDLVQDQTSSAFPTAPPVIGPLLDAIGILHVETKLVALPDSPLLGEHREVFKGLVGTFEEWPNDGPGDSPGFAGATEIVSTDELFDILTADPSQRVAATEYLAARLFDVWIGDWDRHRGQFRWANLGPGSPPAWRPIPEDRDQAFARYDGLFLNAARANAPMLTNFGPSYPWIQGATWNGRDVDRRLLVGLSRAVWDSVAGALAAQLTDTIIDDAFTLLPAEHEALVGSQVREILRARRVALPAMAGDYYRLLAGEVDITATHGVEHIDATYHGDTLSVVMDAEIDGTRTQVLQRDFVLGETVEVRLYLQGGDDVVTVNGPGFPRYVELRVISDAGINHVEAENGHNVHVYDSRPDSLRTPLDVRTKPYTPPPFTGKVPPKDWGWARTWYGYPAYSSDLGLLLNFTLKYRNSAFRTHPFRTEHRFDLDFASKGARPRLQYRLTRHKENRDGWWDLFVSASGMDVIHYEGPGNDTPVPTDDGFYNVDQTQLVANLRHTLLGHREHTFLALGVAVLYTRTDLDDSTFVGITRPYGSQRFWQQGLTLSAELDRRDAKDHPTRGAWLKGQGAWVPGWGSVSEGDYAWIEGFAAGYVTPISPITFAARLGGKKLWGTFPYQNSAYLGGSNTLRGYRQDRFAGNASAYLNTDLRLRLLRYKLLLPSQLGVFGLADVGRVFVDGESAGGWHTGFGGGVWLAPGMITNTMSLGVAWSEEGSRIYFNLGFEF